MAMMKAGPKAQVSTSGLPPLKATKPSLRVEEFFATYLRHVKGEWAGQPLVVAPWQRRDILQPLFNTLQPRTKLRQYRTCYVEVPRKNAKSTTAAGLALYLLYADREPGAEIISAAADREQAHVCFDIARNMVEASPALSAITKIYRRELVTIGLDGTECIYRVISSEAYSKHGMNLHGAIVDELHAHESGELLDVLRTSVGARRQPLLFIITTAGYDRTSVCWQEHEMAEKIRDGIVENPSYLPVLYGAGPEDDWTDRRVWKRVNPGYGVTIKAEYLAQECARAQASPAAENVYKRLHLNIWTQQSERWLEQALWDACDGPADLEAMAGRPCFGGLDLAATTDIAAAVFLFPFEDGSEDGRRYVVIPRFWIPRDRIENPTVKREPRIKAQLATWVRQGYITATSGQTSDTIDNDIIRRDINRLAEQVQITEIGYDPWGGRDIAPRLEQDHIPMVKVGQHMKAMSGPTKELERLLRAKRLAHGGNPVLRWMFGNVAVKLDAEGNMKPEKASSGEKIDGIVALILAIDCASRAPVLGSVYDTRGVIFA